MRHSRSDYDQIQDASGKIPEDEPVFVLRSRDIVAPQVVQYWAELAREAGADEEVCKRAAAWANEMARYGVQQGNKVPDAPAEALR